MFWTVARGSSVGYVEAVGSKGVLFTNKCMVFRPTSSNMAAHGDSVMHVSVPKYATDEDSQIALVEDVMRRRLPVTITWSQDWIDWPWNGETFLQMHLHKVSVDRSVTDLSVAIAATVAPKK